MKAKKSDLKNLYQNVNSCLDQLMKRLPDPTQNRLSKIKYQDKIEGYKTTILQIINDKNVNIDKLWENIEKDLEKKIEETRYSVITFKGKTGMLGDSLIKAEAQIENKKKIDLSYSDENVLYLKIDTLKNKMVSIKSEIHILENANKSLNQSDIKGLDKSLTNMDEFSELHSKIKQKQEDLNNLNTNYEQMKRDYLIQIQKCSTSLEKAKNANEILEMQLKSLQSRIMLMNHQGSFSKSIIEIKRPHNDNPHPQNNLPSLRKLTNTNKDMKVSKSHDEIISNKKEFLEKSRENITKYHTSITQEIALNQKNDDPAPESFMNENKEEEEQIENPNPLNTISPPKRILTPSVEKDKTDHILQNTQKTMNEAECIISELGLNNEDDFNYNDDFYNTDHNNANDDFHPSDDFNNSDYFNKNDDDNDNTKTEPEESNQTESDSKSTESDKVPKCDDISFMPISEEEVKRVARPIISKSNDLIKRIPLSKQGYEFAFFQIAERVPRAT